VCEKGESIANSALKSGRGKGRILFQLETILQGETLMSFGRKNKKKRKGVLKVRKSAQGKRRLGGLEDAKFKRRGRS